MIAHLVAELEADTTLMNLLNAASRRIYLQTSLGIGAHAAYPPKPFVVLSELESFIHREVEEVSNARDRNFQFWAYDNEGDFVEIDKIMSRFRDLVKGLRSFKTVDGIQVSESRFTGISGSLTDSQYHSSCKWAGARFTSSQ